MRAAVGMRQAFRTLVHEQAGVLLEVGLRLAVNTGEVVVSGDHHDVVGDPVNVAARLQQEAQDGDVLVGEATRRLVSDLVTLEPFGTLALKGRAETVAAYRVVSLERPAGEPALAFVGRDDELRRITAVCDAAVTTRAARLAVILGSPGLGKSRLISELVRRLGDGATIVSAHCDATGGATFAPLAEALRGLLRLDDAVSADAIRTAIASRMAADALAALADAAGEAKAHFVQATALARLGEVGACEAALDRALAAARRAGDRRRANAVLAGAPVAALWGPSPVTRASGRCLDVVRVLRITQGAPAVEAVALRCQAVLEALRGRAEAARRMIAASRHLVEELGITQRLLEVEVFAGLIDLLEGDAAAAERSLRPAYDGLRHPGLGIDAAQAAALLVRALLAQDRAAEAETLSHESELLAGDDLKAAIAWRGVRAEALARRGEHAAAVTFARAAVAIAAATDALLDHADARLSLAAALRRAVGGERRSEMSERAADVFVEHPAIGMLGRVMFTLIFFLSGITHFTDRAGYVALMPTGMPFRDFWVMISGVIELAGATMILINRWPRLGAWLIAVFLVPVTATVHGYLMLHAPDEASRQIQLSFFLKGVTMTGAALLITQLGVRKTAPRDTARP